MAQVAQSEVAEQPQIAPAPVEETVDEKAARRRSTVREKVSFGAAPVSDAAASTAVAAEHSPTAAPSSDEAAPAGTDQPRKAGWWSRRFGGG